MKANGKEENICRLNPLYNLRFAAFLVTSTLGLEA